MNLAESIRNIQHSESNAKIRDVKFLFSERSRIFGLQAQWHYLFETICHVVCKYVETPCNIAPIDIYDVTPEEANHFASLFGFNISTWNTGTAWLSWSHAFCTGKSDIEDTIISYLQESYNNGAVLDELQLLQQMLPRKEMQLLHATYKQACIMTPGKRVIQVVEEEPFSNYGLYLFSN